MRSKTDAFNRFAKTLVALVLGIFTAACQTTPPVEFVCTLPSGYNVQSAFDHANSDLSHWQCHYQFEQYMDKLLDIAASDPKEQNKQHFSTFFSQARDNGVISQLQAQEYYRRYFTPDFMALGDLHNNCSTTCRNQVALVKQMKQELRDKQRALLSAVGDRDAYSQADSEYNQLLSLIDATCLACKASQ